jgi:hypothetical protein
MGFAYGFCVWVLRMGFHLWVFICEFSSVDFNLWIFICGFSSVDYFICGLFHLRVISSVGFHLWVFICGFSSVDYFICGFSSMGFFCGVCERSMQAKDFNDETIII